MCSYKYVVAEWSEDQTLTVIPASWVVSPAQLPKHFPVNAVAYWKKPSQKYKARILAGSGERILCLYNLSYYVVLSLQNPKKELESFLDLVEPDSEAETLVPLIPPASTAKRPRHFHW